MTTKAHGLFIGINKYHPESQWRTLSQASNDAKSVFDVLRSNCGNADIGNFVLINDDNADVPINSQLVYDTLGNICSEASQGDVCFFYFAGHGFAKDGSGFLVCAETSNYAKVQTSVSVSSIVSLISDSQISHAIILLDACRQNPSVKQRANSKDLSEFASSILNIDSRSTSKRGSAENQFSSEFILACGLDGVAYESSELNAGVWTHFFVDTIRTAAGEKSSKLTLEELHERVEKSTKTWCREKDISPFQSPKYNAVELPESYAVVVPKSVPLDDNTLEAFASVKSLKKAPPDTYLKPETKPRRFVPLPHEELDFALHSPTVHLVTMTSRVKRPDLGKIESIRKANHKFATRVYLPPLNTSQGGKFDNLVIMINGLGV